MVCKDCAAPGVGFRRPTEHRAAVQRVIGDPASERIRAGQGRDGAGTGAVCGWPMCTPKIWGQVQLILTKLETAFFFFHEPTSAQQPDVILRLANQGARIVVCRTSLILTLEPCIGKAVAFIVAALDPSKCADSVYKPISI
jgi:hypothetical protein